MIEKLKKLNPTVAFYDVRDAEFAKYGRIIDGLDVSELICKANEIALPSEGSAYVPSIEAFESLEVSKSIGDVFFGTLPCQIGYCYGHNNLLGATEWHNCSELNVAVTPLVLILGTRDDIKDGRINSADMKAFFVPQGTVIEVYSTTLHFCPCEVQKEGFGCIVGLARGTNTPLDHEVADKVIFRKNKWLLCHEQNTALIEKGVASGIYGENYRINY